MAIPGEVLRDNPEHSAQISRLSNFSRGAIMNSGWVTIISCTVLLFPIGGLLISMITSMTALASELPASPLGSSRDQLSEEYGSDRPVTTPRNSAAHRATLEPSRMVGADQTAVSLHLNPGSL
jgi:hypothetical protein